MARGRASGPAVSREAPLGAAPRQRRSIDTRRQVYEAAIGAFSSQGFERARVQDIVAAAGVSWGTFFHYFPRKEDVLLAYAVEQTGRVAERMSSMLDAKDLSTREVALKSFLTLLESEVPLALRVAVLREVIANRRRFEAMLDPSQPTLTEIVRRIIDTGRERGEIRADLPPGMLASLVVAIVLGATVVVGSSGAAAVSTEAGLEAAFSAAFAVVWDGVAART